jgi:type IX secretion system PorP/SprF family membrane protein
MKNYFLVVFAFLFLTDLLGQQEIQFTQYNDNMLVVNPAYAGSKEMGEFTLVHRQQWVGFDGAPMTQAFSFQTPLKYRSISLGGIVLNDKIGPVNRTGLKLAMSYSLRFKNNAKLSFGINGTWDLLKVRLDDLKLFDQNDYMFLNGIQNKNQLNAGVGFFYRSEHLFFGGSIPRLLEYNKTNNAYLDDRYYYISLGGYFSLNKQLKVRPSTLFKFTKNAPFSLDFSLALIILDKFWLGSNYRLKESNGVFAQYQVTDQFKAGYSYDFSIAKMSRSNSGTHEIVLCYSLKYTRNNVESVRKFYF